MKMLKLILSLILLYGSGAMGADEAAFQRHVEFEWEPIANAKFYDLELQRLATETTEEALNFKTSTAAWSGSLTPGMYSMRIRSRDRRNVPGTWSERQEFKVGLDPTQLKAPAPQEKIMSSEDEKQNVTFQWTPAGGGETYTLDVQSDDGSFQFHETLKETQHTLSLPVAKVYSWKVIVAGAGQQIETASSAPFTVYGNKLAAPVITPRGSAKDREVQWSSIAGASHYVYSLSHWLARKRQWQEIASSSEFTTTQVSFQPQWPSGKYKLTVQAQGSLRPSSDSSEMEFTSASANRAPATEEIIGKREAEERLSGWFAIASYFVATLQYRSDNYNAHTNLSYNAPGGTGRLGVGYLSPGASTGFLAITDLSGFTTDSGANYSYSSFEINSLHRTMESHGGELRMQYGAFYKQTPETIGTSSSAISQTNTIATIGPHMGSEYFFPINQKIGVQINGHAYLHLLKSQTPTGQDVSPTIAAQAGLLGSYKLRKNLTGLMGYAFKHDEVAYRANGPPDQDNKSRVTIDGHYLNLFLEWAL